MSRRRSRAAVQLPLPHPASASRTSILGRAVVDFVPVGDIDRMVERVRFWIEHDDARQTHVQQQAQLLLQSEHTFTQQLKQALLHSHLISKNQADEGL